jgi:thymidylate synthase (FAD)
VDLIKSRVDVLDAGYVILKSYTPWNMVDLHNAIVSRDLNRADFLLTEHDLSAVNAARASFNKEKEFLTEADYRLLKFLADAKPTPHSSPFRHSHVTLEVNAPLAVCRQWWRHAIGAATTEEGTPWSELSRRYVRGDIECHIPDSFRAAPDNMKQGSGGPLGSPLTDKARSEFALAVNQALASYEELISLGVAPEQARMVLPQSVYTTFRWSPSIQALAQFLVQRLDDHAQYEIRVYALAVLELVRPIFPHSLDALLGDLNSLPHSEA